MEKTLVMLLLCALSSAEEAQPEKETQVQPDGETQSYSHHLYNDILDIRVKLAEDRLLIEQLQEEKKELEAKVKVLEDQESHFKPIQDQLEEHKNKLTELQTLTSQVDTGKGQEEAKQVAFFASLIESGSIYVGTYSIQTVLVFRHVTLNIGNAYSPTTGFFIAPVKGVYYFHVSIYGILNNSYRSGALLVKDGGNIAVTYEHQSSGSGSSSMVATQLLEKGDVVTVHLYPNTRIYDNNNHHCTFSGHLLFPLSET